jgi:hypothetical protein
LFGEFSHGVSCRRNTRLVPELAQPFFNKAWVVNPNRAEKDEIKNNGKTCCNEKANIKPGHPTFMYHIGGNGIEEHEGCHNECDNGIPEIFNFVQVYVVVLFFKILDHENAQLMITQNQKAKDDKSDHSQVHIVTPGIKKFVWNVHGEWGLGN